ncbi:MAG: aspartate/glutamate racemase family protein [Oscillibacter sp.]|jgi:glutamate racemase|nr:aspartate/glutamate racemase family protein [Oscillibacter sp.]
MNEPIAVLAGTPVDTQMGVDCLKGAGLTGLPCPLAENPLDQTAFQISSAEEKAAFAGQVLDTAKAQGCKRAFVYCNSLSGAVDFAPLAVEKQMRIVTPLDVYRELAGQYTALGVISANAQGLSGIERTLLCVKRDLHLYGACCLDAVLAIEAGEDPEKLVERLHLVGLADWAQSCGAEALVLGCTHFPYFKEALRRRTSLPLLDPADRMIELLMAE